MSGCCEHDDGCTAATAAEPGYRRVLWVALGLNLAMFVVELLGGWQAMSTALLADAIDFAGDAANYGVSLFALGLAAAWRSRVALAKGWSMASFGAIVLAIAIWNIARGATPEPAVMAGIALLALLVNLGVAWLLFAYRNGDANMRSVWLCSRNDAISNLAVLVAAGGVFGTGTLWPDVLVALLFGALSLHSGTQVILHARQELRAVASSPA